MAGFWYDHTTFPANGAAGSSSAMRSELEAVQTGFDKLADPTGNAGKIIAVASNEAGYEAVTTTGTGNAVRATSPTLVTPNLGTPTVLVGTNITGTAAGLTVGAATTATSATTATTATSATTATDTAAKTGTGSTYVTNQSPTINTPTISVQAVQTPTLSNSWVAFGAGLDAPGYWKDPFGVVHLRGVMKSGTIGLTAFTLPAGYSPANTYIFPCYSNGAFGAVTVAFSGAVQPIVGSNVDFYLDGISFRAA